MFVIVGVSQGTRIWRFLSHPIAIETPPPPKHLRGHQVRLMGQWKGEKRGKVWEKMIKFFYYRKL